MKSALYRATLLLCIMLGPSLTHAIYSTMETGELLQPGQHRVTGFGHWIFDGDFDGFNAHLAFDTYASESSSFRFQLASGIYSFLVGGSFKWIPIPDYGDQPALGLIGGINYVIHESESLIAFRGAVIASKAFDSDFGVLTPFASAPFGMTFYNGEVLYPLNLTIGAELLITDWGNISFIGETSFKIHDTYSSASFGIGYLF